jgi:hypothetical protein
MLSAMKNTQKIGARFALLATLTMLLATSACGTTVGLTSDRFMPQFDAGSLPMYRGRAILLRNFENVDNSTSFYKYPGDGRRYGGPVLTSYFWYCFKSAFTKLGVNVFEEGQGPMGVPVMDMKLVQINEAGYTVDVVATGAGGQPPLQKRYAIAGPPISTADAAALEARAYQMMSMLFWAIVADPQFQGVALR